MISKLLDKLSDFLARRKGLLPIIGIFLIILNLIVQFVFPGSILSNTNLLLHIGLIISIFGLMLSWAL